MQDACLPGLGCPQRPSWTWEWDKAELLSASLLLAVLDTGMARPVPFCNMDRGSLPTGAA